MISFINFFFIPFLFLFIWNSTLFYAIFFFILLIDIEVLMRRKHDSEIIVFLAIIINYWFTFIYLCCFFVFVLMCFCLLGVMEQKNANRIGRSWVDGGEIYPFFCWCMYSSMPDLQQAPTQVRSAKIIRSCRP